MPTRKLGSERYGLDSNEEGEGMVSARGKQSFRYFWQPKQKQAARDTLDMGQLQQTTKTTTTLDQA